jgi:hypothetical protein
MFFKKLGIEGRFSNAQMIIYLRTENRVISHTPGLPTPLIFSLKITQAKLFFI